MFIMSFEEVPYLNSPLQWHETDDYPKSAGPWPTNTEAILLLMIYTQSDIFQNNLIKQRITKGLIIRMTEAYLAEPEYSEGVNRQ